MVKVIDASVAVKWFIQEEGSDRALTLLDDFLSNPNNFAVPELFFFELSNILFILSSGRSEQYRELLNLVSQQPIYRSQFTPELQSATEFFQKKGLAGYDASYAGLAKLLDGIWVTADKKAHNKIKNLEVSKLL